MHYNDQQKLNDLIIEEINRREKKSEVLILFQYETAIEERIKEETSAKVTTLKEHENPFEFVKLAIETESTFDFILIINPEGFFKDKEVHSFENMHKDLIRDIQMNLLNDRGLLFLATHEKGFKLHDYIKPGADKLTKKVLTEEEREESTLQAFAFYA